MIIVNYAPIHFSEEMMAGGFETRPYVALPFLLPVDSFSPMKESRDRGASYLFRNSDFDIAEGPSTEG
jgi:hypothetical protein